MIKSILKAAQPLPKLQPFTVLLLRPEDDWDGPQADWVLREHVEALDVSGAITAAIKQCITNYYDGDRLSDDFAPLAVYSGHIVDLYDPQGE